MKIAIRGFVNRQCIFEDFADAKLEDLDILAEKQCKRLLPYPKFMIEFEFLDELDPKQRYFRFGTDPEMMVQPIGIDLNFMAGRIGD